MNSEIKASAKQKLSGKWGTVIGASLVMGLIVGAVSSIGLSIFIVGPASVGLAALFLAVVREGEADFNLVFSGFNNFVNTMVTGLLYEIFITLWSMLFLIPGIIKSYSYAMCFYIQNDNPEMSGTEAITASKEMMDGHKMELFLLDLSFIGWILLSCLTCGLLMLYVGPWMNASRAEFYERIR